MRLRSLTSFVFLVASAFVACGGDVLDSDAPDDATVVSAAGKGDPRNPRPRPPRPRTTFTIHGIGNRCWDFGNGRDVGPVGTVVHLAPCLGSPSQQVVVEEIDAHHDVKLHVGTSCLGVDGFVAGAGLPTVVIGKRLLVQDCSTTPSASQRFALDGDAVMMGYQLAGTSDVTRQVVIEPLDDVTQVNTPLVVGTRDANDAEYFRFVASNGPNVRPHSGFVGIPTGMTDDAALDKVLALGWGTVIEVNRSLVLRQLDHGFFAGTTLRGDRKAREQGPEIRYMPPVDANNEIIDIDGRVLIVAEDHVRITGLRLRGLSRSTSDSAAVVHGITLFSGSLTDVFVDHLDASDWTGAAIGATGSDDEMQDHPYLCANGFLTCHETVPSQQCLEGLPRPRPYALHAIGNFVHHNVRAGIGYGISVGSGAFMLARGNSMYQNRHSIAADGVRSTGYLAHDNFVLSNSPGYGTFDGNHEHDFDKHGTFDRTHWQGGISDDYVDFGWNTFLGRDRRNIEERGTPCGQTEIHDNIFPQAKSAAIKSQSTDPSKLLYGPNVFGGTDPVGELAVADFDADGVDDVFVGTGATWWYASGGSAEWRFLNRMPEGAGALRFGDFDGDGRADVATIRGGHVDVSWAGISPWQNVNAAAWSVDDLAVGDFDGDHRADLFLATGETWFVAPHADGNWQYFATSGYHAWELRFGDFDADGKTDVFGVTDNQWQYVPGGTETWVPLRTALTSNVDGLVVGDFDGDGYADIGRKSGSSWQYAARGWGGFVTLRNTSDPLVGQPIGRFDGDEKSDVLVWNANRHFQIASGARSPVAIWSAQDMK